MLNAFLHAQLWWPLRGCVCAQLLSAVWLFVTPWTCSLPGSSVHGIFQARIPDWVAISSSRASPFLTLPTQNKVQMRLLNSLRIVVILLGSQILTDDVMTQKEMQKRQPIINSCECHTWGNWPETSLILAMALQSTLEAVWLGLLLSSLWKGE